MIRFVPLRPLLRTIAIGAALALGGVGLALSYTVQVVALSDLDAALDLQRRLQLEGYPAYVVRATTGQGDLYRVRVGAFANRAAALSYAAAMPEYGGARRCRRWPKGSRRTSFRSNRGC